MTIPAALAEYERILYRELTPEEYESDLKDLIDKTTGGRASGSYRPAYDPCEEDDPLWP
jgi:hypothetical protein